MFKNLEFYNLIDCSTDIKRMIWKWRNNPDISKFMLNPKRFTFKQHLAFVESLKEKKDKLFFIVKYKDLFIGLIDFYDLQSPVGFWGYYLNPEFLNSSYGIMLEYIVCEYAFNTLHLTDLKCETFDFNERALAIHKEFGFEDIGNAYYIGRAKSKIQCLKKDIWEVNKPKFSFVERFFND